MRIVVVAPGGMGADGVHGVIPALRSLTGRLAAGHDVLVIATDQVAMRDRYELDGVRVLALGGRRRRSLGRLRVAWRAMSAIRAFRPDVIHAVWLGSGSTLAVLAGGWLRVPVVASVAGGELVWLPRIRYGGWGTARGRWHARLALRRAAAVTTGSRALLEALRRRRPDARWLPLGADRPESDSSFRHDAGGPLRLVVAASVNRVKGPEIVLGALARAKAGLADAIELEWLGEDTLGGSAKALARALGVTEAVRFRGLLEHRRALEEIAAADVMVQGSHHESQGVAVLEAAMAGVPTVGTATGLVAELAAADPPAAVAVPVGDAAGLGDAILELARDPERRARLGAAARAWAERYDAEWTAGSFETIYGAVAAAVGRRRA